MPPYRHRMLARWTCSGTHIDFRPRASFKFLSKTQIRLPSNCSWSLTMWRKCQSVQKRFCGKSHMLSRRKAIKAASHCAVRSNCIFVEQRENGSICTSTFAWCSPIEWRTLERNWTCLAKDPRSPCTSPWCLQISKCCSLSHSNISFFSWLVS